MVIQTSGKVKNEEILSLFTNPAILYIANSTGTVTALMLPEFDFRISHVGSLSSDFESASDLLLAHPAAVQIPNVIS